MREKTEEADQIVVRKPPNRKTRGEEAMNARHEATRDNDEIRTAREGTEIIVKMKIHT